MRRYFIILAAVTHNRNTPDESLSVQKLQAQWHFALYAEDRDFSVW